ncbi:unnamed protein product [Lactuca saligna]|uniref:Uncharacterized protein n=1 Tax=Lactuca saligna TaxID=75948 RepID=A0AA35YSN9_LACSI|nr:unnamed protein product [Lactuca saligna]
MKQGLMFREILTLAYLAFKKRKGLEVVQKLKKVKPSDDETRMEKVKVETYVDSKETNNEMDGSFQISPRKDTSVKFLHNLLRLRRLAGKSSVSGVDVEYLLKPQESRTRTSIESMEKKLDEKLSSHS